MSWKHVHAKNVFMSRVKKGKNQGNCLTISSKNAIEQDLISRFKNKAVFNKIYTRDLLLRLIKKYLDEQS